MAIRGREADCLIDVITSAAALGDSGESNISKGIYAVEQASKELDRTDRRILALLQQDGRMTNAKLAEAVHMSPTATLVRVRRLTTHGYILGYRARLNPLKLGMGMLVFVEVLLDRTTPNVLEEFKQAVKDRPEVVECHLVAGGFDYLIKLRAADMSDYRDIAARVLWRLPGVRETRTYAVMEEVKNNDDLHLDL